MSEEIKKEVLKAIELYIEGGKNPAGGAGKDEVRPFPGAAAQRPGARNP